MIEENEPKPFRFSTDQLVSAGRTRKISIDIYRQLDPKNMVGPKYRNNGEKLNYIQIKLNADVSQMSKN